MELLSICIVCFTCCWCSRSQGIRCMTLRDPGIWQLAPGQKAECKAEVLNFISWRAKGNSKIHAWGPNEHHFWSFSYIFVCIPDSWSKGQTALVGRLDLACRPPVENPCCKVFPVGHFIHCHIFISKYVLGYSVIVTETLKKNKKKQTNKQKKKNKQTNKTSKTNKH